MIIIKWSAKENVDNAGMESYFSYFQQKHITKYEIDLMGNAVKKDNENSHRYYGTIENELMSLVNLNIIHTDLPEHILRQDLDEIYPALAELDTEIEVEINMDGSYD